MTAIMLTDTQRGIAYQVAREIGAAFHDTRIRRGDEMVDVARALDMPHTTVARFERGEECNAKLGNIMRMLSLYGLTLEVVPMERRS